MWTKEQKQAIDIRDKNILVSASAGSGKTAVLIERVIQKVINEKVDVNKILVVTFTKAAASELKQKLVKTIEKAIKENKKNYFLKRQLDNISKASITTIHSFCLEIIRSHFYKLQLDPSFSICDDINSKLLKSEAMIKVIEDEYKNYDTNKFGIYNLLNLYNLKDDEFMQSLIRIFDYIQSFERPFEFLDSKVKNYNILDDKDLTEYDFGKEIYLDVIGNLEILLDKVNDIRDKISKQGMDYIKITTLLDEYNIAIKRAVNSNSFDTLYKNLNLIEFPRFPTIKNVDENVKDIAKNFINDILKEDIKSFRKSIYAESKTVIKGLNKTYPYLEYINNLIVKFNNEYVKLKKESNLIDFNDIEHFALELLTENIDGKYIASDIAKEYKNKFEEVYTDEYQDTSFIQEAILNSVAKENNRFMVGDIKQSIYRFRQAMPEIFTEKYSKYVNYNEELEDNDTKVILAKNFRSREKIIDSINYMFYKIMSNELGDCEYKDEEALAFGATRLLENKDNNYNTEINIIDTKEVIEEFKSNEKDENDVNLKTLEYINELKNYEIEAKYIVDRIQKLVLGKEFKVFDEKTNDFRDIKYKDIVILLRGLKNKANILEEEFKKNEIPCFSDTSSNVFDNDEIRLVMSILKVIDNPYQDIDMVAVMYSLVGKFTSDEIYEIKILDKAEYIYNNMIKYVEENKGNDLSNKVNFLLNLIYKLTEYSKTHSIAEVLNKIYVDTNIYLESFLINKSKDSKINLDSLIVVAKKQESNSIYSYITYVETLREKAVVDSTNAKTIGENEDVVKIMTIHKSKGLEFPVVILSDTASKYNMRDNSAVITLNHKYGLGLNVIDEDYYITYPSIIKEAIKLSEVKISKAEELRVLYVALTRAKEKLIVYSTIKDVEKKINDMYIATDEKGKIEPMCVLKNNSFSDNILMSLNNNVFDNSNKNLFDINVYNFRDKKNLEKIIKDENKKININELLEKEYNSKNEISQKNINELSLNLKENIEKEYKFNDDILVATRVSVSKLKEESMENHTEDLIEESETVENKAKYKMPKCIQEEENISAVRKGTLIHFILQYLDFRKIKNKNDLIDYINYLCDSNIITEKEKQVINVNKIYKFLTSDIGLQIVKSNLLRKEEEFVFKDLKYSKSIIQGVIDLYFKNEDGDYTLVDFKTDNITNEIEFLDRYKLQLDIYKDALEKIQDIKVSKVYIYSFKLDKVIEVK